MTRQYVRKLLLLFYITRGVKIGNSDDCINSAIKYPKEPFERIYSKYAKTTINLWNQ